MSKRKRDKQDKRKEKERLAEEALTGNIYTAGEAEQDKLLKEFNIKLRENYASKPQVKKPPIFKLTEDHTVVEDSQTIDRHVAGVAKDGTKVEVLQYSKELRRGLYQTIYSQERGA